MKRNSRCKWLTCTAVMLAVMLPTALGAGGQSGATAGEQKPLEIGWHMKVASGEDTSWWVQQLEERFNVKITPSQVGGGEEYYAMLAAGEFPDCGPLCEQSVENYLKGIIRGIPIAMIREHMPNYTKYVDENMPIVWEMDKNPDNPDEVLTIQGFLEQNSGPAWLMGFRADWAENLGFELPNYESKKIPLDEVGRCYFLEEAIGLDWLEDLFVAFRDGDPDGNGKVDTIPWMACQENKERSWSGIDGAFGFSISPNINLMVDGEFYENIISPPYKQFLKHTARWYAMGLVDKEFPSIKWRNAIEKVAAKQIGACVVHAGWPAVPTLPPNTFASDEEVAAGAEVVMIGAPVGPTGLRGIANPNMGFDICPLHINKDTSDEKLIRILQMWDLKYGSKEDWIGFVFGKEGVHFDWSGEPWDSAPVARAHQDVPAGYPKVGGFPTVYPVFYTKEYLKYVYSEPIANFYETLLCAEYGQKLGVWPYRLDVLPETGLAEVNMKYKSTLNTIVDEFYFKAITGQANVDAEWDSYVAKWRKSGGDQVLAELEKAPIMSELRKGRFVY